MTHIFVIMGAWVKWNLWGEITYITWINCSHWSILTAVALFSSLVILYKKDNVFRFVCLQMIYWLVWSKVCHVEYWGKILLTHTLWNYFWYPSLIMRRKDLLFLSPEGNVLSKWTASNLHREKMSTIVVDLFCILFIVQCKDRIKIQTRIKYCIYSLFLVRHWVLNI